MTFVKRLLAHFANATPATMSAGLAWYREAAHRVMVMATRYRVSKECAAGVIAALSPRVRWAQNLKLAELVLGGQYKKGAFKVNLLKAQAIARGAEPSTILRGDKVRAFYAALLGDRTAVVVDVWMLRAVRVASISKKLYAKISAAVVEAAALVGQAPALFQAVVWSVVRGKAT